MLVAICSFLLPLMQYSHAATGGAYGVGRIRSCSSSGGVEGLDFDPTTAGKDAEFTLEPLCISVITSTYAAVIAAIANMNKVCQTGSPTVRIIPSPIQDSIDIVKASARGIQRARNGDASCGNQVALALTSWSITMAELYGIYLAANNTYQNTRICGAHWLKPNIEQYNITTPSYKNTVETNIQAIIEQEIRDGVSHEASVLKLETNKTYREWYYQGVEVNDDPINGSYCQDVGRPKDSDGSYPPQRYYLQGLEAGNYNCQSYDIGEGQNDPLLGGVVTDTRRAEFKAAYDCCKKRSSNYICLEYSSDFGIFTGTTYKKFCQAGSLCDIKGIQFKAVSVDAGRLVCAETKSLCPYNFSVSGGTEYCDYYKDGIWNSSSSTWKMITQEDILAGECANKSEIRDEECTYNEKSGKCRNYCQFLTHCTRTSSTDYNHTSSLASPYFATACRNFVGDSQNRTAASNGGFLLSSQTHFSAPIAQCVKETMENLFHNRVGHSQCLLSNEYPSANGVCPSGEYINEGFVFKKGNRVSNESFFATIQRFMHDIVLLVIILSVTFYGMNILLAKINLGNKKEILIYLLKIGLVTYFALGQAWQTQFFNGIYGASSQFALMVFNINEGQDESKRDGCQFGDAAIERGAINEYPAGKEYLAIWDTLDCKLMRYMGMGPTASPANIAMLLLAAFLTGSGIGLYFALSVFIFAFFFLAATIRALHLFLSSCVSIILMVFISPIIIPLILFEKTKDIFTQWFKELISFILQPMILFAYIAIFIAIMDKAFIGSATFHGNPPYKGMSCNKYCQDIDGVRLGNADECDAELEQKIVDPLNDSVACLLNFDGYGSFPGLHLVGITIPVLINIFDGNVKDKIIALLKGALVMYLLYAFMDQISGISKALIGGSKLPGSDANAAGMLLKAIGKIEAVGKRAARGGAKLGKNRAERIKQQIMPDKDKSSDKGGGDGGDGGGEKRGNDATDDVQSSRGGGDDDTEGSGGGGNDDASGGSSNEDEPR